MRVRVASWPSQANNPYVDLLYDALESRDVHLVHGVDPADLERREDKFDALHLHWPEGIWRYRGGFLPWRLRGLWDAWRGKTDWEKFHRVGFSPREAAASG